MAESKMRRIDWYRVPLEPEVLKALNSRSDLLGFLQSAGYLATVTITGGLAIYAAGTWHWGIVLALLFLHGTCYSFMINAVHELGHGTVFKSKWLNGLFVRIFAFLGMLHFKHFNCSHVEHHRYTLHPPDDLEVTLPIKICRKDFAKNALISPLGLWWSLRNTLRLARGKFEGEWELKILPEEQAEKRRGVVLWARYVLIGHALIIAVSLALGWWMVPIVVTLAPFYGNWLFFLCNNTQHVGLKDNVTDFRLCCRTMYLNPVVQFLYWHMNYHTEHHMYAAVPCYRLGKLHRIVKHELPPVKGMIGTWQEIGAIMRKQQENPEYQHEPTLPRIAAKA